jgi:hypothetical protein
VFDRSAPVSNENGGAEQTIALLEDSGGTVEQAIETLEWAGGTAGCPMGMIEAGTVALLGSITAPGQSIIGV